VGALGVMCLYTYVLHVQPLYAFALHVHIYIYIYIHTHIHTHTGRSPRAEGGSACESSHTRARAGKIYTRNVGEHKGGARPVCMCMCMCMYKYVCVWVFI
jgi:hypothetical protein